MGRLPRPQKEELFMYACAQCTVHACSREGGKNPSPHCPMNQTEVLEQAGELYKKPEFREFCRSF